MQYRIGPTILQSDLELPSSYDVFRIPFESKSSDYNTLTLEFCESMPDLSCATKCAEHELMIVWKAEQNWIYESVDHTGFLTITPDYSHAVFYTAEILPSRAGILQPLLQALLECHLIYNGTGILHASGVAIDGQSVLFSALSGTGKSERAKRWVSWLGASWISGDRPAINPGNGNVYGVPWDGKEQMFINTVSPIGVITEIHRSGTTLVRQMTVMQKRQFLAKQLLIPMWDPILVRNAFLQMNQIISRFPVYRLYSDITETSIRQAYDILFVHPEQILNEEGDHTMRMKENFNIVEIAGDYMAVPTGDSIADFSGTVILNEVSAFILKQMKTGVTEETLLECMLNEYEVDRDTAAADLKEILNTFTEMGLIE